ncbi:MAG: mismatch repair protein MutT [Candidatus Doudnabacteria bacterium]|nr:mismatch repair protein MutT [Candidatus Doudnabacteria bacterium]
MEKAIWPVPVGVIVNDAGEVYMQRRHDPESPAHDKWELPGGGMVYGEKPEQTVIREIKEETNLDVEVVRLLPQIFTNVWPNGQVVIIPYQCRLLSASPEPILLAAEVSEYRFLKPEQIDHANSLPYCKEIIELLKS